MTDTFLTFEQRQRIRQERSEAAKQRTGRTTKEGRHVVGVGFALSPREVQVLKLSARGLVKHEIAAELHLAEPTVSDYVKSARSKLCARTVTHAVALAMEQGLLEATA